MVGRLIVGVVGQELSSEERDSLGSPELFGVILFTRNYRDKEQLKALISSIKVINETLLIFVDQEGAIWRFDEGFARIPTARALGDLYDQQGADIACKQAQASAALMANELKQVGVDITIAPVVDVHDPESSIIGQRGRAFHEDPDVIVTLANAFIQGLNEAGFSSIIKHFPGHGSAHGDTHTQQVTDSRSWDILQATDLKPFRVLLESGAASAVMVGHVIYPAVDEQLAVFSKRWNEILRAFNPDACVFTDCLGMAGAGDLSDHDKCARAVAAGCDVLVYSNEIYRDEAGKASVIPKPIPEVLKALESVPDSEESRVRRLGLEL